MDRLKEMLPLAKELFQPRLADRLQSFSTTHDKYNRLCTEYRKVIADFIQAAQRRQADMRLGAVSYLMISYLHSSAITKTYEFEISLMNERFFLDSDAYSIYWCPKIFFDFIEEDMEVFAAEARKRWIRIRDYEFDDIRRFYANECNGLAALFFAEKTLQAAVDGGVKGLDCGQELKILYGGYMDKVVALATIKRDALQ